MVLAGSFGNSFTFKGVLRDRLRILSLLKDFDRIILGYLYNLEGFCGVFLGILSLLKDFGGIFWEFFYF